MADWIPLPSCTKKNRQYNFSVCFVGHYVRFKMFTNHWSLCSVQQHYQRLLSWEPLGLKLMKITWNNNLCSISVLIYCYVNDKKKKHLKKKEHLSHYTALLQTFWLVRYDVMGKWLPFRSKACWVSCHSQSRFRCSISDRSDVAKLGPQSEGGEPSQCSFAKTLYRPWLWVLVDSNAPEWQIRIPFHSVRINFMLCYELWARPLDCQALLHI